MIEVHQNNQIPDKRFMMMSDTDEDCGLVSELLSISKPRSNPGKTSKRKAPPISSSDSEEDSDMKKQHGKKYFHSNQIHFYRLFIFFCFFVFYFKQFPLNEKGGNKRIITN